MGGLHNQATARFEETTQASPRPLGRVDRSLLSFFDPDSRQTIGVGGKSAINQKRFLRARVCTRMRALDVHFRADQGQGTTIVVFL